MIGELKYNNFTEIIMQDQPNKKHFLSTFKNLIVEFLKDKIELTRLVTIEKIVKILAPLFAGIILVILFLFAIIFLSFVAGIYFSHLLQNSLYGFGIVAAFYLIIFLILTIFRKQLLEKFILNSLIHLLTGNNEIKENL